MRVLIYGYGERLGSLIKKELEMYGHELIIIGNVKSEKKDKTEFIERKKFNLKKIDNLNFDVLIFNGSYREACYPSEVKNDFLAKSLNYHLFDFIDLLPVIKMMVKNKNGKIIVTSNIHGVTQSINSSVESVGKVALETYLKTLRNELKIYEIKIHILRLNSKIERGYSSEGDYVPRYYHDIISGLESDEVIEIN